MAERKRMNDAGCPVARAVDIVGDRWSLLILRDAFDGIARFGDFQTSLGVARNILAGRLKMLVAEGVLAAEPASAGSAYLRYVLTPRGRGLFPLVVALRQWGEDQLFSPGEPHSRLVEKSTGLPVARLVVSNRQGDRVEADALEVVDKPGQR
ncbi:transcriptional regulator [Xylophilus rhododendri]|uniref:Transcriptional regulator n=1 Tax=Xylophilus rhododendri TaxID=2697032 RepID=A0A857JBD4_9BURK|nr:helix-turn-helix domain-containing protein [Xylophilus rhododendri]QHJ01331.1 transcriptional regulator [Xylophilus rhododendri]